LNLADFVYNFRIRSFINTCWHSVLTSERSLASVLNQHSATPEEEMVEEDEENPATDKTPHEEARKAVGYYDDGVLVIRSIHRSHQVVCSALVVLRVWVLLYMWNVGSAFILATHSFADLLLNSLALAFIMDMPEFLFKLLVSDSMKSKLERVAFVHFRTSFPSSKIGRVFLHKHFWGLVIMPAVAIFIVRKNDRHNTIEVLAALRCACQQTGETCLMASKYGKWWWDQHWLRMARLSWPMPPAAAVPTSMVSLVVGPSLVQLASNVTSGAYFEL